MSDGRINEKILNAIKEKGEGDKRIQKFLLELLIEEASHSGYWQWKDIYRKKIKTYTQNWGDSNEN